MIKLAVFVSFVAAGICLNSSSNHIKKFENNILLLPNTQKSFESYKTSIFEVFTATVSNLSEIEKTDSLFQRKKLASNNNIMSYFNARNLSSSQLDTLRTLLNGACWRDSFGRGAGESVSDCSSAQEKDGSLCYPKCDEGYKGVGPVCWEICRPGFVDRGIFCIIDLHIFNKGCCCVLNNCCKNCPTNYTDDGCTCRRPPVSYTKKSYGRGTGMALNCKENYELNGLLCYPMCQEDYTGNGPVCWFVIFFFTLYTHIHILKLFFL